MPANPLISILASAAIISLSPMPLRSQTAPASFDSQYYLNSTIEFLKRRGGGVLCYDTSADGNIASAILRALEMNADIFDRFYNNRIAPFGLPATPERPIWMTGLARANGWQMEPRWIIVDGQGRVAFSSTEPPTEDLLLEQLISAGVPEISKAWEGFLKEHPDRTDALARLSGHR